MYIKRYGFLSFAQKVWVIGMAKNFIYIYIYISRKKTANYWLIKIGIII